jgi:hypothetical protein
MPHVLHSTVSTTGWAHAFLTPYGLGMPDHSMVSSRRVAYRTTEFDHPDRLQCRRTIAVVMNANVGNICCVKRPETIRVRVGDVIIALS